MSSVRHRPRLLLAAVLALSLVLGACGEDADSDEPASSPDNDTAEQEDAPQAEEPDEPDEADDGAAEEDDAEPEPQTADLDIVVTTTILGDVVASLVAEDGEVTVLMPPGADPHGYQPSAADAAAMRDADLVVANGLMLEENLVSALEAAVEDGVRVLELAEQLDPIGFEWDGPGHSHGGDDDHGHSHGDDDDHGHSHGDDDDHGHSHGDDDDHGHSHGDDDDHAHGDDDHAHGPLDPHFWFDPLRMADAVGLIAAELAMLDDGPDWQQRAEALAEEYRALDAEIAEILSVVPEDRRLLVTNHDALGYLADRHGFTVVGTVIPGDSTQAEPDPAQFAELIDTVEEFAVPAVFAETIDSTRLAEQLASEVIGRGDLDVEVVRIYTGSLGEPGTSADTYPGMLRTTAQLIADALS